jgi:hypothetical protein
MACPLQIKQDRSTLGLFWDINNNYHHSHYHYLQNRKKNYKDEVREERHLHPPRQPLLWICADQTVVATAAWSTFPSIQGPLPLQPVARQLHRPQMAEGWILAQARDRSASECLDPSSHKVSLRQIPWLGPSSSVTTSEGGHGGVGEGVESGVARAAACTSAGRGALARRRKERERERRGACATGRERD